MREKLSALSSFSGAKKLVLWHLLIKGTSAAVFGNNSHCCPSGSINILNRKHAWQWTPLGPAIATHSGKPERNTSITAHSSPEHAKRKLDTDGQRQPNVSDFFIINLSRIRCRQLNCFQVDGAPFRNIYCERLPLNVYSLLLGQQAQREGKIPSSNGCFCVQSQANTCRTAQGCWVSKPQHLLSLSSSTCPWNLPACPSFLLFRLIRFPPWELVQPQNSWLPFPCFLSPLPASFCPSYPSFFHLLKPSPCEVNRVESIISITDDALCPSLQPLLHSCLGTSYILTI